MTDLSLYKVDLDTPQPNGRSGESPRSAFTKYNDLIKAIEDGTTGLYVSDSAPGTTFAHMEWIDTSASPAIIKRRNAQNTAWVSIGSYEQKLGTAAGVNLPSGVTELKNTVGIEASQTASASKIPQADSAGKISDDWLSRTAMSTAVEVLSGGKNVLLKDAFGNAQMVYRQPIFTFEDLAIPNCPFTGPLDAFIRQDGSLRPYVDIPVYLASSRSGKAVSEAGRDPWTPINADTARSRCAELGGGAVMMGREIMAMLGWKMIADGFQPRGNTEYGRSHSNTNEFGRRADELVPNDRGGSGRTMTGTGPETWRHDGTSFGIADLVGNVWEWDDGWKMVNGQFYVAEYTGQDEADWVPTGVYINESGEFSAVAPATLNSGNKAWADMTKAAGYAGDERLQRLLIEPIDCSKFLIGSFYWNLDGERFPLRGGSRSNASIAGPAALNCTNDRSYINSLCGFRSAFVS